MITVEDCKCKRHTRHACNAILEQVQDEQLAPRTSTNILAGTKHNQQQFRAGCLSSRLRGDFVPQTFMLELVSL
jgi:hypothetical protein